MIIPWERHFWRVNTLHSSILQLTYMWQAYRAQYINMCQSASFKLQITSIKMSHFGSSHPWVWISRSNGIPHLWLSLQGSSCDYDSSPHPAVPAVCFHKLTPHSKATILPPMASPYPRLVCFGCDCHPKNPVPLYVLWHQVSLDFNNSLVVLDQYLQQFVSPVKCVSNLTQLMRDINGDSVIWGQKTQFRWDIEIA